MYTSSIEAQLHSLRSGDRLMYSSIDWYVEDYSSYEDDEGYETEEWLLVSSSGKEYYLLREYDDSEELNDEDLNTEELPLVTWYISEQLHNVHLYLPNSQENILPRLWQEMQALNTPYPELKLFYKVYHFGSRTEGSYGSQGRIKSRITWDYWDKDNYTNLAIEAFPNRQLEIYSSKKVKPEEFYNIQKGVGKNSQIKNLTGSQIIEIIGALFFLSLGLMLMIFG